jgi:cyclic beta-1,2-glucan synthetase
MHEQELQVRQATSQTALRAAPHRADEALLSAGRFADADADAEADAPAASEGEFAFEAGSLRRPPRPWINVLANPDFGCHVSEAGAGTTWAVNSRLNQLTPWSNDPVADPPAEWLLLQDLRTREVWSLAPSSAGEPGLAYSVRHGQGYSVIAHQRGELQISATWCVDATQAVKQVQLRIVNHGPRTRHLRLVAVCEWMLGAQRSDRASVHTALVRMGRQRALLATQQEASAGFGGGTAFLALVEPGLARGEEPAEGDEQPDWTCDRRECFDARGRPVLPDHFGRQQGSGMDPCAALAGVLHLPGGASAERVLLLGWAPDAAQAAALMAQAAAVLPDERAQLSREAWDALLGATHVRTPDPLFDALVNRWLLYQAVACRLWAKAGFYQAGGATGFRDQLQDAMALAWAAPALLREQIVRCASRQFTEGDVQHWWHAPQGAGVRTHFSDDLLWLPYALVHYLQRSGDESVLEVEVPFIEGLVIAQGAEDIYGTPAPSSQSASVYEHAARTIDASLRVGSHGLPLMGSGDWNDGMNRVGHQGRGESVWLAWFLCRVVADFAPLAQRRGDVERAARWQAASLVWQQALAGPAWDGGWYIRAFFDDGEPLGSHVNVEARIDLIAQAWAVLGGAAPAGRQTLALAAVQSQLVDADAGLVRLLTPPLAHALPSAGYIQAYPPGVRENGGQYSHAGVWALMAQAAHAKTLANPGPGLDLAWQYFRHLSPAHRSADPRQAAAYGIEPYVMAGDTYSAPPYVGRGGWSWYTGAAAWLHRAALESILGLEMSAQDLRFVPGLPSHWPQAELTLRRDGRSLHFLLLRARPEAALAAAAPWGQGRAVLLLPGQRLPWPGLAAGSCFVVPVGA